MLMKGIRSHDPPPPSPHRLPAASIVRDEDMNAIKTHPVQANRHPYQQARVSINVTLKAYEVYKALFREQEALITGNCRGGFGVSELVAFLYAGNFPRNEWRERFDEALEGMEKL
jgi:hypothetical protein